MDPFAYMVRNVDLGLSRPGCSLSLVDLLVIRDDTAVCIGPPAHGHHLNSFTDMTTLADERWVRSSPVLGSGGENHQDHALASRLEHEGEEEQIHGPTQILLRADEVVQEHDQAHEHRRGVL